MIKSQLFKESFFSYLVEIKGDQASIVGGAIDFVKELEQLLQSLEAQKRMRKSEGGNINGGDTSVSSSSTSSAVAVPSNGLFMSLSQFRIGSSDEANNNSVNGVEVTAENKSEAADIEVTVIQTHVNLKIQCPRRPGQLLKAIIALEDLRLTILHLNITTSQSTVLYSFNLKVLFIFLFLIKYLSLLVNHSDFESSNPR